MSDVKKMFGDLRRKLELIEEGKPVPQDADQAKKRELSPELQKAFHDVMSKRSEQDSLSADIMHAAMVASLIEVIARKLDDKNKSDLMKTLKMVLSSQVNIAGEIANLVQNGETDKAATHLKYFVQQFGNLVARI